MRFTPTRSFYIKDTDTLIPCATIDQSKAVAYLRQFGADRWAYLCFMGSATKPCRYYSARTREAAEQYIAKFYEDAAASFAAKAKRQEERKAAKEKAYSAFQGQPGSVFVATWGYEQTNVDAYQVVRRLSKTTVEVVEIGLTTVSGGGCAMSDVVVPAPVSQEVAEAAAEKMVMRIDREDSLSVPHMERHAYLWDGKQRLYRSWYA